MKGKGVDWLERKLRTIGKASFEKDRDVYEAYATGLRNRDRSADVLIRGGRSRDENGAGWRLGAAKAVFKAGLQDEALRRARNRRK